MNVSSPQIIRFPVHQFQLVVENAQSERLSILLEEKNSTSVTTGWETVAKSAPLVTRWILPQIQEALVASSLERTALPFYRAPLSLSETAGVRLALLMEITMGMTRIDRIVSMAYGIDELSDEECYYWFAKCNGERASFGRKALRVLLAP